MNDGNMIVDEFMQMVKINSESRNERDMANDIIRKLKEIGLEVTEDNAYEHVGGNTGNVIGKLKGNSTKTAILFSAHMDRVSKGKNIKPVIDEKKIKSDGTTILAADDVAGIVSILDGLRKIQKSGIDHGNIEVVFSVCEEKGVLGSKFLDYSQLESKMAFVLDSSGPVGRIVNQAPTKVKILVNIFGKAAHAGNEPENGVSAIKIAAQKLSKIRQGRLTPHTTSNFGIIKGGEATNVVCDHVELTGEARSRKEKELEDYLDHVKSIFMDDSDEHEGKIEIDFEELYHTFRIEEDEEISIITKNAMKACGIKPFFSPGGGGMDANRFNKVGIKAIGLGTGYSNNHTTLEEIDIEDLKKSGELVENIIIHSSKT